MIKIYCPKTKTISIYVHIMIKGKEVNMNFIKRNLELIKMFIEIIWMVLKDILIK